GRRGRRRRGGGGGRGRGAGRAGGGRAGRRGRRARRGRGRGTSRRRGRRLGRGRGRRAGRDGRRGRGGGRRDRHRRQAGGGADALPDACAYHVAEHQVDVGEPARQQVAVAHDRAARGDHGAGVAARLARVALVERRRVAVGVGRAEVVAELVGDHEHVPDLRRLREVEAAGDLRHAVAVAR